MKKNSNSISRLLAALICDIRYQIRYGFYLIYFIVSVIYAIVLFLCPPQYQKTVASLIILTDPAVLGAFFIGGIWLLEKGEGLHGFWKVSPLRSIEYIFSKTISLSFISTLAAILITLAGLDSAINYILLTAGIFLGAMFFTIIGLLFASYARSVNHYMLTATIPLTLFLSPAILTVFGISIPLFDLTPGTALWKIIALSIGLTSSSENIFSTAKLFIIIIIGFLVLAFLCSKRIPSAMNEETGV